MSSFNFDRVCIVAELGTAHGGDFDELVRLVRAAKRAGADWIKGQVVFADEILHPLTGAVTLPGGEVALYESFKALERDYNFYLDFAEIVLSEGAKPFFSVFGPQSLELVTSLDKELGGVFSAVKIASPELNYRQLIREAALRFPLVLSTGVSKLGDMEAAASWISEAGGDFMFLHCVTSYPAPEEDYNLNLLPNLSGIFGCRLGVSDHSRDAVLVPALAVAKGAVMVEKHFCLSRDGEGLDDPIALTPDDFSRMTEQIREAEAAGAEDAITKLRDIYGTSRIEAVLGDGIKRLAKSEKDNYGLTNRSIHALNNLEAGKVLREEDVCIVRTEKKLRPGLAPVFLDTILGKRLARDVAAGEGIVLEDFMTN